MIGYQCLTCKHLDRYSQGETATCVAFKDGIPSVIMTGKLSHKKPYPGDGGIQYEPVDGFDDSDDEADDDND